MACYPRISHVIFDVDGLLIDTENIYTEILNIMASRYNKKFTWDLKIQMMGKKQEEAAQIFIDYLEIPMTVADYGIHLKELYDDHMKNVELMPGADRLVRHLHRHGVPIAIATGSSDISYQQKIQGHHELFSLFSHVVCSGSDPDVKQGKPAPDCFLVAARRFSDQPQPTSILVFEDAPNGVSAALAAGMSVVWVPHPQCPAETIYGLQPSLLLKSLLDFQPELFTLPAFDV